MTSCSLFCINLPRYRRKVSLQHQCSPTNQKCHVRDCRFWQRSRWVILLLWYGAASMGGRCPQFRGSLMVSSLIGECNLRLRHISQYCWSLNSSVIWSCVFVLFPQVRKGPRNFEAKGANKITQLYISENFTVQIVSFLHYGFCSNRIINYNAKGLMHSAVRDSNLNKIHPVIRLV